MEVNKYKERPDVKIEAVYIEKINKDVVKLCTRALCCTYACVS